MMEAPSEEFRNLLTALQACHLAELEAQRNKLTRGQGSNGCFLPCGLGGSSEAAAQRASASRCPQAAHVAASRLDPQDFGEDSLPAPVVSSLASEDMDMISLAVAAEKDECQAQVRIDSRSGRTAETAEEPKKVQDSVGQAEAVEVANDDELFEQDKVRDSVETAQVQRIDSDGFAPADTTCSAPAHEVQARMSLMDKTRSAAEAVLDLFTYDIDKKYEEELLAEIEMAKKGSTGSDTALTFLEKARAFCTSYTFDTIVTLLLTANVVFMATEMQVDGLVLGHKLKFYEEAQVEDTWSRRARATFLSIDLAFTVMFAIDVFARVILLGRSFWKVCMNWIDFGVVTSSIVVAVFRDRLPVSPIILRLLRLGKLARALRMVEISKNLDSLQLLLKCLASSVAMLFWSFLLLILIQSLAGMIISNLVREYLETSFSDPKMLELQQEVFVYYGTFSRTFLTMFEVMFANWSPPCRVVVDHISEWFSLFFLFYRCVIGFAVLNVLNAVFIQQTMKCAQADEEHAFKTKTKDQARYAHLIAKLFQSMDNSGDGIVTEEEFKEMVDFPKLRFWLSRLDLEYHDLLSLFELLDDGDGRISLDEFSKGVSRLKGNAKSIDIWRMEMKLEALVSKLLEKKGIRTSEVLREVGLYREAADNANPQKRLSVVPGRGSQCSEEVGDNELGTMPQQRT